MHVYSIGEWVTEANGRRHGTR